jgi:hypothetical protein
MPSKALAFVPIPRLSRKANSSRGGGAKPGISGFEMAQLDPAVVEAFIAVVDEPAYEAAADAAHTAAGHVRTLLEASAV